jgi:hypothetical protein
MMGQIFSWTPAEWGEIEVGVIDKGTSFGPNRRRMKYSLQWGNHSH